MDLIPTETVVQNGASAGEEDDFGDFNTVEKALENGTTQPKEGDETPSNDLLDFGDFASPALENSQQPEDQDTQQSLLDMDPSPPTELANEELDNDDFGDFGSAAPVTVDENADNAEETTDILEADNTDSNLSMEKPTDEGEQRSDLLGTPEAASNDSPLLDVFSTPAESLMMGIETNNDNENENENGSAGQSEVEAAPDAASPADETNDEFGDFGAAIVPGDGANTNTGHEQSEIKEESSDDLLGFGTSGSAVLPTGETTSEDLGQVDIEMDDTDLVPLDNEMEGDLVPLDNEIEDDDFGGFGAAEAPTGASTEGSEPSDEINGIVEAAQSAAISSTEEALLEATTTDEGQAEAQEDDFGDFGTAAVASSEPTEVEEDKPVFTKENGDADDTFPDFGTAAVAPSETTEVEEDIPVSNEENVDADDTFGDFGTAVVASSEAMEAEEDKPASTEAKEDDNDDDFGDFGTAAVASSETAEAEDKAAPTVDNIGADDTFGDFDTAAVASSETAEDKPASTVDNVDADVAFGNFGTAAVASSEATEVEEDKPVSSEENGDADDAFGDFGTATGTEPAEVESKQTEDSFGDFDIATGTEPAESKTKPTEDSFGDFGAATSTERAEVESKPTEDSFGDFGTATSTEPAEVESKPTEDSFGDFGTATGTETAEVASKPTENSFGDFGIATSTEPAESESKPTEDSFGDFGAAASAGSAEVESKPNEDSFGDFGAATSTEPAEVESKPTEDSFGDFNDVPTDANRAASESGPDLESKPTEDSFGDFNAVAAGSGKASEDDDDFGDFGSAPEPEPVIDIKMTDDSFGDFNDTQAQAENSNDDFGDFDSAPVSDPPPAIDDEDDGDFGNFSTFEESSPAPAPAPAQTESQSATAGFATNFGAQTQAPLPVEEDDPVLHKARAVFSKLFHGFPSEKSDGDDGFSDDAISIETLMSSADVDQGPDGSAETTISLIAVLKEIEHTPSPSVYIVSEGQSYCPNAHFSVNLEGESAAEVNMARLKQFEVNPESPVSEPVDSGLPSTHLSNNKTPSKLPAASTSAVNDSTEQVSDKCRTLLQQIPDLSYMVLSKLSLPSNIR